MSRAIIRLPKLHDLTLGTLFASPSHLPWLSGSVKIRQPPSKYLFVAENDFRCQSDESEMLFTKRRLDRLLSLDKDFLQDTLRNGFLQSPLALQRKQCHGRPIHMPASLYLLDDNDNNSNNLKRIFHDHDDTHTSANNFYWIHCSSFRQVEKVATNLLLQKRQAGSTTTRKSNFGICLPYPANLTCANILFGIDTSDSQNKLFTNTRGDPAEERRGGGDEEEEGDDEEEKASTSSEFEENLAKTLEILSDEGIPSSIWLLSGLSCPFGGSNAVDPVEVSDHVVTFLNEFGCSHVFVDDTAGTVHSRLFEDFIKTLFAVSASSPPASSSSSSVQSENDNIIGSTFVEKVSFCLRTSQCNNRLRNQMRTFSSTTTATSKRTKRDSGSTTIGIKSKASASSPLTHRCLETMLQQEVSERMYRCYVKAFAVGGATSSGTSSSGILNFCGSFNTRNYCSDDDDAGYDDGDSTAFESSLSCCFAPLPIFTDWHAELTGSTFTLDPLMNHSETSLEGQKRFLEMEKVLSENVEMMRKLNDVL